jgi:hypothetical protein
MEKKLSVVVWPVIPQWKGMELVVGRKPKIGGLKSSGLGKV